MIRSGSGDGYGAIWGTRSTGQFPHPANVCFVMESKQPALVEFIQARIRADYIADIRGLIDLDQALRFLESADCSYYVGTFAQLHQMSEALQRDHFQAIALPVWETNAEIDRRQARLLEQQKAEQAREDAERLQQQRQAASAAFWVNVETVFYWTIGIAALLGFIALLVKYPKLGRALLTVFALVTMVVTVLELIFSSSRDRRS
jgi:hypothetical protein